MTPEGGDGPADDGLDPAGQEDRLEAVLEEIVAVTDPVLESVEVGPAVGIAVSGPMVPAVPPEPPADAGAPPPASGPGSGPLSGGPSPDGSPAGAAEGAAGESATVPAGANSLRGGLLQAGPVAVAGLVVNGAAALVVVAVARLVTPHAYGEIAQLLGLFFILSMPGSAVLVGVVRRVSGMTAAGHTDRIRPWMRRIHRSGLIALGALLVVVAVVQGWLAHALSVPDDGSVFLILMAGGIWVLLSIDRGLLQAHRSYNRLAGNLLVEGGVRTVLVLGLVGAHLGVVGYAAAVFVSEVVAAVHAHWLAGRVWGGAEAPERHVTGGPTGATSPAADDEAARRRLAADVGAAFCGLALLGFLQNVDVLLVGRLDHHNVGPYAAISVASKALVFGALALGAYLLPEATIRWNQGGHAVRQLGVTLIFLAVPAAVLVMVSVFVPRWFLTVVFGARLSAGAPGFAELVGAMICLSFTVLVTNYLFGTGSRWIVWLLAAGSAAAAWLVSSAHGAIVATARADLVVQAVLAVGMGVAFVAVHLVHHEHLRARLRQLGRARVAPTS